MGAGTTSPILNRPIFSLLAYDIYDNANTDHTEQFADQIEAVRLDMVDPTRPENGQNHKYAL